MERAAVEHLLTVLKEIEELLHIPSGKGHIERAAKLATLIARAAPPEERIPHLAMLVAQSASDLKGSGGDRTRAEEAVNQLRTALRRATAKDS
jgi:hypothetical protein